MAYATDREITIFEIRSLASLLSRMRGISTDLVLPAQLDPARGPTDDLSDDQLAAIRDHLKFLCNVPPSRQT